MVEQASPNPDEVKVETNDEQASSNLVEAKDETKNEISWPLLYRMQIPEGQPWPRWWCHDLYRGPKDAPVEVLYSKDKAQSEILAKKFLGEAVVGFDMEWPWDSEKRHRLQEKVGLIQVASLDKIALFHIGLHPGKTTDEIVAPSLRELIESPTIAKAGVAILNADFSRLKKYFGLKPQGAFELSNLHRLIKFGQRPELLTTKLVKLAQQVEEHLGLPLSKGDVRTSNWSRALNKEQIKYAASDAYAGFMLFHRMNAKRTALKPTPPLPIFAEKYRLKGRGMASITDLQLYPLEEGGEIMTAKDFFRPKEEKIVVDEKKTSNQTPEKQTAVPTNAKEKKESVEKAKDAKDPLDPVSKVLYSHLAARRKALAEEQNLPLYCIATNAVLETLARRRPERDVELLDVKGIGKIKRDKYGSEWLEIIARFLAKSDAQVHQTLPGNSVRDSQTDQPVTPSRKTRRRRVASPDSNDSSTGFDTPVQRTPHLHTGLSFTFAETQLNDIDTAPSPPPSPTPHQVSTIRNTVTVSGTSHEKGLEDSLTSATPTLLSQQSRLKRKRQTPETRPASPERLPAPLSPQSRIYRSKLLAFSKLVVKKLPPSYSITTPIVSDWTLDCIVTRSPQTLETLHTIPGIETFAQACKETDMDLLRNIIKFAPVRQHGTSLVP
jgi:ribonuclease D